MAKTDPAAIARADEFTVEANDELADLTGKATDAADLLARYTAGPAIDVHRLAANGTDDALDAWRDTRRDDARLQILLARWRDHWKACLYRGSPVGPNLMPRGLDVYAWTEPEACDCEDVRHGATWERREGLTKVRRHHVDLVRVAQQTTAFRLLGPTDALHLLGPDGVVQEGHPLKSGLHAKSVPYRPGEPTWIAPRPQRRAPSRYVETGSDRARALNEQTMSGSWHARTG